MALKITGNVTLHAVKMGKRWRCEAAGDRLILADGVMMGNVPKGTPLIVECRAKDSEFAAVELANSLRAHGYKSVEVEAAT